MKKILLPLFLLLILTSILTAQNWKWAKVCEKPMRTMIYGDKGLVATNTAVYSYWSNYILDSQPTCIQACDLQGNILFSKHWITPFYIKKMISDGGTGFFFTGVFSGTQTLDGFTIRSQGNSDGMTGRMDSQGKILWIHTFGGQGEDQASGICLNPADNSLLVSGMIDSTLYLDNYFQSGNYQSGIILKYSKSGNILTHKLFSYKGLNNTNNCQEVVVSPAGGIYLLLDRRSHRFWDNDPGTDPIGGRYLTRLDSSWDTLWTKYLNGPQSSYGWACSHLTASANGDIYVLNWTGGKYGGGGEVQRYDGISGKSTWSYLSLDGIYKDIFSDHLGSIYVTGIEGANACPCPDNHPGYNVLRKFASDNSAISELRVNHSGLFNVCKDQGGNIFVLGGFNSRRDTIGGQVLLADSIKEYGGVLYIGNFIAELEDPSLITSIQTSADALPGFDVYPNPSNGLFTIRIQGLNDDQTNLKNAIISVSNMLGERLSSEVALPLSTIDLSARPKGTYFVELLEGEKKSVKRIVLQ